MSKATDVYILKYTSRENPKVTYIREEIIILNLDSILTALEYKSVFSEVSFLEFADIGGQKEFNIVACVTLCPFKSGINI